MKKAWIVCVLVLALAVALPSCGDYIKTPAEKDGVADCMAALRALGESTTVSGEIYDEAHCFQVTPRRVAEETDIRIFRFSNSFASFALINGALVELGYSLGGYGFLDALPADVNGDGVTDLLFSSSWGVSLRRTVLSVLDGASGEVTAFYDSADDRIAEDLVIREEKGGALTVYRVDVRLSDDGARLSYKPISAVGQVTVTEQGPQCILSEEGA